MKSIPLLSGLKLKSDQQAVAVDRLCEAFAATWQRIPNEAKDVLGKYFEEHPHTIHLCYEMDFDCSVENWELTQGRLFHDLGIITFLEFIVLTHQPESLISVICHELAHCYHHGKGVWVDDCGQEEENARATQLAWGMPERGMDRGTKDEWLALAIFNGWIIFESPSQLDIAIHR